MYLIITYAGPLCCSSLFNQLLNSIRSPPYERWRSLWGSLSSALAADRTALHGERFFQAALGQQGVVVEDLQGGPVGLDRPPVQDDGPLAELDHHVQIMAGEDFGVLEIAEQAHELAAGKRIEAAGRLIHDQDVRRHGKDGGNGHPFLLPTGKMIGRLFLQMGCTHLLEDGLDPLLDFIHRQSQIERPEGHIIKNGGHEELIVRILENHTHRTPDLRQGFLGEREITDANLAGIGSQIAVDAKILYVESPLS